MNEIKDTIAKLKNAVVEAYATIENNVKIINLQSEMLKNHNECIAELQNAAVEMQNAMIELRNQMEVVKNSTPDVSKGGIYLGGM